MLPFHYGYGRVFSVVGQPTLQEKRMRCFEFCNKLDVKWGGFKFDECCGKPLFERQQAIETIFLRPQGIITTFAAVFTSEKAFLRMTYFCTEWGVKLYLLDIGDEEVTSNKMLMEFLATAAAARKVLRCESTVKNFGVGSPISGNHSRLARLGEEANQLQGWRPMEIRAKPSPAGGCEGRL